VTDIASHRGGALLWPENSRIAFEATAGLAVEQVEFDVHAARDGALVVIHDDTLERTTDGSGPVAAHDWATLSRLVLKGAAGQRMLRLEEVIAIFRPTPLILRIEIKCGPGRVPYPGLPERLAGVLTAERMAARCVLTSFQIATVADAAQRIAPQRHVWLVTPATQADLGVAGVIAAARAYGVPMLGLRAPLVDAQTVAAVRAAGLGVGAYAVNDAATIARMLDLGLDVFTTDRPDLALELRAAHASAGNPR
jgi:glycerophosphoryl diester phosphodiesterase